MKASAPVLVEPAIEEKVTVEQKSAFAVISDLVKARLTALVLVTTLVGFYAGSGSPVDYWKMLHALLADESYQNNAAAAAKIVQAERGTETACDAIEEILKK